MKNPLTLKYLFLSPCLCCVATPCTLHWAWKLQRKDTASPPNPPPHPHKPPSSLTTLFIVSLPPWILCFNTCCSVQIANTAEGCLNPKNKLFSLQCVKQHSMKTFQLILAEWGESSLWPVQCLASLFWDCQPGCCQLMPAVIYCLLLTPGKSQIIRILQTAAGLVEAARLQGFWDLSAKVGGRLVLVTGIVRNSQLKIQDDLH